MSNGELYNSVMEKLRLERGLNQSDITVPIKDEGSIGLRGKVESNIEKSLAEEVVEKMETVKGVVNEITVNLALSNKRSDLDILKEALDAFSRMILLPHEKIKFIKRYKLYFNRQIY